MTGAYFVWNNLIFVKQSLLHRYVNLISHLEVTLERKEELHFALVFCLTVLASQKLKFMSL